MGYIYIIYVNKSYNPVALSNEVAMNIKIHHVIDSIINFFCRIVGINYAVHHRILSDEEVKALGLDRLEKGQKMEKWIIEKPTEM